MNTYSHVFGLLLAAAPGLKAVRHITSPRCKRMPDVADRYRKIVESGVISDCAE
jgi:hypothetical protein